LDGSAVNLFKPKLDHTSPRFFGDFLNCLIETLNQPIDESRAGLLREHKSVPEQISGVSLHGVILARAATRKRITPMNAPQSAYWWNPELIADLPSEAIVNLCMARYGSFCAVAGLEKIE